MSEAHPAPAVEAWLRGPIDGLDPWLQPAGHALLHACEDLARAAAGLSHAQLWARPGGSASIGFHIRHAAGAAERLLTYARGLPLDDAQRAAAQAEGLPLGPDKSAEALAEEAAAALHVALEYLCSLPREILLESRAVGRARLPSTVLGLAFHATEHAARHAGQALTLARIVRSQAV
jgi:hypothetical protein